MRAPRVLMVAGAYYPEVSGGGVQCRELVRALRSQVQFHVIAVTALARPREIIDGAPVDRIAVDVRRPGSRCGAGVRLAALMWRLRGQFDVLHLHGYSDKNILLTVLAALLRKRIVLTLHTAGFDEPAAVRARGRWALWSYRKADVVVGVSPLLQRAYEAAGLPQEKFRLIQNGIDVDRFRPVGADERRRIRQELGMPESARVVLFVGFFSREKSPHVLFEAWAGLQSDGAAGTWLILIGATKSAYAEVDPALAQAIRAEARRRGLAERVRFVETTQEIEKYYRAADLFVLPSVREGLPVALLEAMASGLPCIASRLPGATDAVIQHGANGWLTAPGDVAGLQQALAACLKDPAVAKACGDRARDTVVARHSVRQTASAYAALYQSLMGKG